MDRAPFTLDDDLKRRLVAHARAAGVTVGELVRRLLDDGLEMADHPGVVLQRHDGTVRAVVVAGPDVDEVVDVARRLSERGEDPVPATAIWLRIPEAAVRAALDYDASVAATLEPVEVEPLG